MSLSPDIEFSFTSKAVADDFFQVLEFSGFERVADLYQFDIQLLCQSEDYDLDDLLSEDCQLTLDVYGEHRTINGVLSDFKYLHPSENGHLYQAVLVPKLWRLTQITTNEVYLDQALPETLEQLLQEADLNSEHYDLSMLSGYRKWDYRCQFGESHYNFLKRITEREGVYFYFEQGNSTEQIIFCDVKSQHPGNSINSLYSPLVGMSYNSAEPITFQWIKNSQRIAKKVTVKDYNNDRPSEELSASVEVDSKGFGEVFRYCENLVDRDEAENLVQIRAEELLTQKHQFFGASLDVRQQPLQVFVLSEHPLQSLNDSFYPIEISHSGYAPGFQFSQQSNEHPYSNEIKALKSDIQFRPALVTEKPRFYGVINAIVDSVGEGQYAHLDERGRYKIILPFDRANKERDEAQASWWIAMAQPNAGENSGMHFPLLKGAEVLLSFIAGDPDRPVITGAVPNAAKPSVVREDNHTVNKIKTASNNIIEMEDQEDSERIKLYSPNSNSYFHLGAANPVNANGLMMMTSGGLYEEIAGGYQMTLVTKDIYTGNVVADNTTTDVTASILDGTDVAYDMINEQKVFDFAKVDKGGDGNDCTGKLLGKLGSESGTYLTQTEERSGDYLVYREAGNKYYFNGGGNTFTFFGTTKDFCYGTGYEVTYVNPDAVSEWDGSLPNDLHPGAETPPSNMILSKMIGDTYDYQKGTNEGVHVGKAVSHHHGDSIETAVGSYSVAGNAIANQVEGGVFATDIEGKLCGVSISAEVNVAKFELDLSALTVSLSKAHKEIGIFEGDKDEDAEKNYSISAGKVFSATSAPAIPTALSALLKAGAAGALGGAYVGAAGGGEGAAYGAGAGAVAGAWAAAALAPEAPKVKDATIELDYTKHAKLSFNIGPIKNYVELTNSKATIKHMKAISIEALKKVDIKSTTNNIVLSATIKNIDLKGGQNVNIKGNKSVNITGNATTMVKSQGQLSLKGNALQIQGKSATMVKASGVVQVKGSILQLG